MKTKTKTKTKSIIDTPTNISRLDKILIASAVLKQVTKCSLKQLFNSITK